jgi:hypothetical protein
LAPHDGLDEDPLLSLDLRELAFDLQPAVELLFSASP